MSQTGVLRLVTAIVMGMAAASANAADRIDFNRDVRPILSEACFACHGPDQKQRKAKLRLDTPDGARQVVVAGKPAESELIARISDGDPAKLMPPAKSGKLLKPHQKEILRKWIEQGAKYSSHWAFVAPVRPSLPPLDLRQSASNNPIDSFVGAKRQAAGLKPAPEADRLTLFRRVSLDLVGLPPTLEETDAFLKDDSPRAYEKQVERLLASPHYGERWGRHWLDGARYADSDGYEKDKPRFVWAYRDWVINALNRDLPYDRFIIEQIAGDLLPDARQDQRVATGFLRNSMINEEGGIDPEQFRMEAMFDRMEAVGKSVLGLTIQCAQCHTHKFDPLTHEEYYRLFAFLNNSHEANIAVYTPDELMKRNGIFRAIQEIEADLRHRTPDWKERMAKWEESVRGNQPEWAVLRLAVDDIATGGQKYLPKDDGSYLAQGYAPTKHKAKFTVKVDAKKISAFRLELLNDPNLPLSGPGRSLKGTAALTEFEVEAAPAGDPGKPIKLKFAKATADVEQPEQSLDTIYDDKSGKKRVTGPVSFAIDGKPETAWGIDAGPARRNHERKAVFTLAQPIENPQGTVLTIYLSQMHGGWNSDDNQNHNLGRFRLSITGAADAVADPLPRLVRESLSIEAKKRTITQLLAVFDTWRTTVPEWKDANAKIEELWNSHPEPASQLVLQQRDKMRPTSILERGDFLKPKKPVTPGVPAYLHPLSDENEPPRLAFAKWLVDRKSPTTARALVNRAWQTYFGTGLVSTSEDFGIQSDAPSHPDLLDWLAVEFMEQGWSLKQLHRQIVTSATYRQSSKVTPELLARDPDNRLLARGPRFRVEAEVVRDIALAASGLLNDRIGGPSVYPDAPGFLFQPPASYGPKVWKQTTGEDRYRRGLYTFRFRSVPYPMLQTFDAPNGDFACVRRVRSNTPLQALTTLNEPIFLDSARALALKTVAEKATDEERLTFAFRRCLTRKPTAKETHILLGLLKQQRERFAKVGVDPWELAASDPKKPPKLPQGVMPAEVAAWTVVSRVLLNLDETITKE